MEDCENDRVFHGILEGLVAQNLALGQRQVALEAICSALMAEICLLHRRPDDKMLRLSAELNGAATAIADNAASMRTPFPYDTVEMTKVFEGVTRVAEEMCRSGSLSRHPGRPET